MRHFKTFFILFLIIIVFNNCSKDDDNNQESFSTGLLPKPENYNQFPSYTYPTTGSLPSSHILDLPVAGNQGKQGSCTAWAVAYGMQSYYRKKEFNLNYNNNTYCSPSYVFNQIKVGDCLAGSRITDALELLKNQGVCTLSQMGYNPSECSTQPNQQQVDYAAENKITSWSTIPQNVSSFKYALYDDKPIIIAAHLNHGFHNLENINGNKIWKDNTSPSDDEYHAMVVCGWNDNLNAFKVLNSWGSRWGQNGFLWVDYSLVGSSYIDQAYIAYNDDNSSQNSPTLYLPANNSSNLNNPINFSWQNVGGNSVYRIQVSSSLQGWNESNGFPVNSNLLLNHPTSGQYSFNSYSWSNSQPNTTYYWSVKVFKNGVSSNYSQPFKFTTSPQNTETRIIELSGDMSFGNVNVGSEQTRTLAVKNIGNSVLTVSRITLPQGFIVQGNQSFNVQPNQTQNVNIKFQPQSTGYFSGNIVVTSNATSGNNTRFVNGTGVQNTETRIIELTGDMSFGNVNVGSEQTRTLAVMNIGNSVLTVSGITLPQGFIVQGNQSFNVQPNQTQNVNIKFQPQSAGYFSGYIVVTSNATSGNNTIFVNGTGVQNTETRIIELSGDMSFGNVNVGSEQTRTLTVMNIGNSVLTVSGITLPQGFIVQGNQSFNVQPNQTQNVNIKFQPQSAGYFSGNIVVSSNATSGNNTIFVSGTGINNSPTYTVSPNINVYTSGSTTLYGNCSDNPNFPVYPNVIKLAVTQITSSTITLRMEKVSGTFQNNGNFYLKQNGICGSNLINARPYQIGWYYLDNIQIQNNLQPGQSIILYGLIISNTTDRYYAGPITITRNQ